MHLGFPEMQSGCRNPLHFCLRGYFLTGLAEYPQKITAADFTDLLRCESGSQHRVDDDVIEPGRLILPRQISALPDARAAAAPTRSATAATGLGKLTVRSDAHMIDADNVRQRPYGRRGYHPG